MKQWFTRLPWLAVLVFTACATTQPAPQATPAPEGAAITEPATPPAPTPADALAFLDEAEKKLLETRVRANRASWVQANFITEDTQLISSEAGERDIAQFVALAKEASRFDNVDVPADARRKLSLLKRALTAPAPSDPEKTKELARLASRLEAMYGEGKYCGTPLLDKGGPGGPKTDEKDPRPCEKPSRLYDLDELSARLATSRDPKVLLEAWQGWHTISPQMRPLYQRFVELSNEGARELGYADTGALWRSKYDMPPQEFAAEVDRLWGQVKPLYDSLHCYVRWKLNNKYGDTVVPPDGPIPAHLLGNMWAQQWGNIYDLVAPKQADPGFDLTKLLQRKKVDEVKMVQYGEGFFTSLGFDPLPKTFWSRSLIKKPRDREVVCHASAWNIDEDEDVRLKMCTKVDSEDFQTVHHELGHTFYQLAYRKLPFLFRDSANDGFHEALGDAVALSITPSYLVKLNLLDKEPDATKDIGLLMKDALEKVAFLPFGLLVDQWRWKVFSGEVTPANYNQAWWQLREKYQGVAPPVARSEADFDPGAKYHIPGNTPYTRYFLAFILQFQFHRALCDIAGYEGPLNRCSVYGNKEAGQKLKAMMELGQSRPWPDALEALTGQRQMDATAIVDYFQPLKVWLDQQNQNKKCGW